MKTLILICHCTTPWNLKGRAQGHQDIELHPQGIKEAYAFGARLQEKFEGRLQAIISSDLKRAAKTAEIINTFFNIPIIFDKRLRECSYGVLEGLTRNDVKKKYSKNVLKHWDDNYKNYDFREFGGENKDDVLNRYLSCIAELPPLPDTKMFLLVGHGAGLNTLFYALGREPNLTRNQYAILKIEP